MRDRWRYVSDRHPANCTCVACMRSRQARRKSRSSRRFGEPGTPFSPNREKQLRWNYPRRRSILSRWNRGFWCLVTWVAVRAFVLAALIGVGVTAYHWHNSASIESALRMVIDDYRLVTACPTETDVILNFVRRPPSQSNDSPMSARYGDDWARQVCDGDIEYATSPDLVQSRQQPVQVGVATATEIPLPNVEATISAVIEATV